MLEDYLRLATDLHPDETDRLLTDLRDGRVSGTEIARRIASEVVKSFYGSDKSDRAAKAPGPRLTTIM